MVYGAYELKLEKMACIDVRGSQVTPLSQRHRPRYCCGNRIRPYTVAHAMKIIRP